MKVKLKYIIYSFFVVFLSNFLYAQKKPDALVLFKNGKYSEAIRVCETEINDTPNNIDSYVVLAWSLLAVNDYEKTYNVTKKGRKIAQSDPRLIFSQAESCYHLGKNNEALGLFQDYVFYAKNGQKLADSYYFMGEIYLRLAKYRHADIAFSVAVTLDTHNSFWWTRLGYAREQTKDYLYSLEAYNKALSLNKNSIDAGSGRERVLKFF